MTLKVNNLSKTYGTQKAVNDISFSVDKGEIVGFLGPNGAGKSTTMKMLTCYIQPTSGDAEICGKSILEDTVAVRRHIGYLPENNPLYHEMYVKEYLEFIAGMYQLGRQTKKRVAEMVELTGLGDEQHKTIGQLSKGYRQRVGMAQALLHNPDVLILDEPTSGLDVNQIQDIRELIIQIGKEKSVLLSTHIMQEVQALCQRVIIINKGQKISDSPTNLLGIDSKKQEVLLVAFKNPMSIQLLQSLSTNIKVKKLNSNKFTLQYNAKSATREELFKLAVEQNNPFMELIPQTEDLETVFKKLTQKE